MIIIRLLGLVKSFFYGFLTAKKLCRDPRYFDGPQNLIFVIYEKAVLCDTESEKEAHPCFFP